jgi:FkbM family methyltransferase
MFFYRLKRLIFKAFSVQRLAANKPSLEEFLDRLFVSKRIKTLVQIGANDGIQNDPLREYLISPQSFRTILVEPITYYCDRLRNIYSNRPDVTVIQSAAGSSERIHDFFYLPPELASEMNGDGPKNDWAHGQGSFSKETVIHWITANSFRGDVYCSRINYYIDSIICIQVKTVKTDSILPLNRSGLLLVIDVQGHELSVLEGIDWDNAPSWIIVEDDLDNSNKLIQFLNTRGFDWIAGDHDKVFQNRDTCPIN